MKKFNFKKIGITVLSFVLVVTVFISCFAFSASAATASAYPFTRSWLYEEGLIDDLSNAYDVFIPTADLSGATYYRCDINGNVENINSNKGQFTVSDWGHGTLNNGQYSYSRRIGFKQTFDYSQYTDFRTISNFMKIPKGETVKISFYFRITGTVYGWENTPFLDNISMSYYTSQSYKIERTTAYYNTGGETSYWFVGNADPVVGVGEGTPCTVVCISQYVTAGTSDVFINSIHFNLNRIRWGGDIGLNYNGTIFLAGLVVDWNSDVSSAIESDNIIKESINESTSQNKNFFESVLDFFDSFFTKIFQPFSSAFNTIRETVTNGFSTVKNAFDNIGGFFGTIIQNVQDGFDSVVSFLGGVFKYLSDVVVNIIIGAIRSFGNIIISLNELTLIQEGKPLPNVQPQFV